MRGKIGQLEELNQNLISQLDSLSNDYQTICNEKLNFKNRINTLENSLAFIEKNKTQGFLIRINLSSGKTNLMFDNLKLKININSILFELNFVFNLKSMCNCFLNNYKC